MYQPQCLLCNVPVIIGEDAKPSGVRISSGFHHVNAAHPLRFQPLGHENGHGLRQLLPWQFRERLAL